MNTNNSRHLVSTRLISNFSWLLVSEIIFKGLIFLTTVYLARVLGAASFGLYSLSLAIAAYIWLVADLGVSLYGAREVAKNRKKAQELLQTLNSMRILIALPLFLLLAVVVLFSPLPLITKKIIIAGCLYTIGYALSSDWLLRGMEQIRYVAFGNSVLSCTFLLSVLFFVRQPQDAFVAAFLRSISFFFASGALLLVLKRKFNMTFKPRLSLTQWKVHLKESWYFALTSVVGSVTAPLIIILIGVLYSSESVGFFTAPYRIIMLILGFMGIFTLSFYPVLADQFVHTLESFLRTHAVYRKIMLVVGIPLGVGGFVLSRNIIHLLFGDGYGPSVEVFNILIWLIPFGFIQVTYSSTLLATGFQRLYLIAMGISCVIAVVLCSLLIPFWGIIGAAVALLCQQIITSILVVRMFQQQSHRFTFFDCYFIKVLTASIIMGAIIWSARINVFGRVLIGITSYGLLALLLKLVTREQILSFYSSLKNIRKRESVVGDHSEL
jgi:O-antigen/teichoic acid export membrane protein